MHNGSVVVVVPSMSITTAASARTVRRAYASGYIHMAETHARVLHHGKLVAQRGEQARGGFGGANLGREAVMITIPK